MPRHLPSTPAEVLDISTPALRRKVNFAVLRAKIFGHWKQPYQEAATSFDEMTLQDIYYWVYKCANPITHWEKGQRPENVITDKRIVSLPQGFEKSATLTLGAGGDLLQAEGLENSRDILFENVADLLFDQDISYANLESPITTQPLKKEIISDRAPPTECCSRTQFAVLGGHKGKRFTVMNTTNNHMFDMGVEGVETTQKVFAEEGILDVGTNRTPEEANQGKILVKNGVKIGFVAVTFGLNGHAVPENERYRIHVAKLLSKFAEPELDGIQRQIDHCKREGCDFIVASLHWGFEFEFFPRQRQVDIAHRLVEYGADAILAHHPHVIQPVEYYHTERDPNRVAVIAHSLGSLTWGFTAPHLVLSMILNLTLAQGRFKGKALTYIEKAEVTPVFRSCAQEDGRIVTRIEKLVDHIKGRSTRHAPGYIAKIQHYANLVLGE